MADAFTQAGKTGWHYQFSVPFAYHASDLSVYFGPPGPNIGPDMVTAFRRKGFHRMIPTPYIWDIIF